MPDENVLKATRWRIFMSSIFHEPLFTLYGFIGFILYKDLHASAFQIALLSMLKPLMSILSFYWGSRSRGRLRSNLLGAGILMRVPFLFAFVFDSPGWIIAASVNYMLFYRAGVPALMEIIKRNVPEKNRSKLVSLSSAVGYAEGVILSLAAGALLDHDPSLWRYLFVGGAFLGIVGSFIQAGVPIVESEKEPRSSLKEIVFQPWKDCIALIRQRPDFAHFQWGLMLSGLAIMLIQPTLPLFAVDVLGISYIQMAAAISIAKGLGYVASAPIWGHWMTRYSIHHISGRVFLVVALFPLLLVMSQWGLFWLYIAYFCYGIGQGGSHLVWSLSGPHFAGKEESARYTGVNVAMAGIRGAIGPPLGSLLSITWGVLPVFVIGALLCTWSGARSLRFSSKKSLATN